MAEASLCGRGDLVFRFVEGHGGQVRDESSGTALLAAARKIASALQERCPPQARVILCFSAGLDFVRAFYGCLFGDRIAVPLPVPGARRDLDGLARTVRDCAAALLLAPRAVVARLRESAEKAGFGELPPMCEFESLFGAEIAPGADLRMDFAGDRIGWLQYTSGSTGAPKGVAISHRNALANVQMMAEGCSVVPQPRIVSWLPHFHDMGLVVNMVGTVAWKGTAILMSPLDFMKRPRLWLEMISRWKGTTGAAPNFALDLCVEQGGEIEMEGRERLDLSTLSSLVVGAEPVRRKTLERFHARFAAAGLRAEAMMPGYGLAESTLYVCSGRGIEHGEEGVACGVPLAAQVQALLVNPETRRPVGAGEEGEIWLRGPSIARGYWRATEDTFGAELEGGVNGTAGGGYLRTGDLGRFSARGLVITGRIKDLLIVRGKNHSPSDLEETLLEASEHLYRGGAAVFQSGAGQVVAAVELRRHLPAEPWFPERLQAALSTRHQINLSRLVLVKRHALPKTSSGKIQRRLAQKLWEEGALTVIAERDFSTDFDPAYLDALEARLGAEALEHMPLSELGIDSLGAVTLVEALDRRFGLKLSMPEFYELTTVGKLLRRIRQGTAVAPSAEVRHEQAARTAWAVSGIGVRVAGARSVAELWGVLAAGEAVFSKRGAWAASWTRGIFRFDPKYFKISYREAALMDPQQRWLLTATVEALADAGLDPAALAGRNIGVFIGLSSSDFYRTLEIDLPRAGTGVAHSLAANRLSHFFDWTGPSMVIDCACSSSLVALDAALKALQDGSCEAAIVGGANFIFSHDLFQSFSTAGMLSASGECRPFDVAASGYVRGEGCGVVVLEAAGALRRTQRPAYAEILGSAVRHNGRSQTLTAPHGEAQRQTIELALQRAGARAAQVEYVEAHGTGTPLGDSIELRSLRAALGGQRETPLHLGSVKSVLGHQEASAGILGLIKALLIRSQRLITPQAGWREFSPQMCEALGADSGIAVASASAPALSAAGLVGVSSFGFGGANAHAVVRPAEDLAPHSLGAPAIGLWSETLCAPDPAELSRTRTISRDDDWH